MISDLIGQLIVKIWQADTDLRTGSALGEAPQSRRDRKLIAAVFTLALAALVFIAIKFGL